MKSSRKAILLSALVLPGLGQVSLKRYKMGIAILIVVTISIYQMMQIAIQQANAAVNKLMLQSGTLDIQTIRNVVEQSSGNSSYQLYFWLIIACWAISIIDIKLVTKKN